MDDRGQGPPDRNRRELLRALAGSGLLAAGVTCFACDPAPEPASDRAVPASRLPDGERVRVQIAGDPVELVRRGDEVRARSLLCTHFGCEVRWSPTEEQYLCPCHDGRFDARGRPVAGPPTRPLRELTARIRDGEVVVEGPAGEPTG